MSFLTELKIYLRSIVAQSRNTLKPICANVDFLQRIRIYDALEFLEELFTPIFAIARIAGWSAHRMEELVTTDKIIRPAYKSLVTDREYIPRDLR